MSAPPAPEVEAEVELAPERALLATLATLCALVAALFMVGAVFHEEVLAGSRSFVQTFGAPGVALGFLIPDATALPLPHDAFLAAGLLGGLSFGTITLWASAGSILGGLLAWGAARALSGSPWFARRSGRKVARARALFERYGEAALAFAAVTPLPYSLVAWASGGLGLPLHRFLLISLLRIVRVAGYLWAIQKGYVELLS